MGIAQTGGYFNELGEWVSGYFNEFGEWISGTQQPGGEQPSGEGGEEDPVGGDNAGEFLDWLLDPVHGTNH